MKKLLLSLSLALIAAAVNGQVILTEDFNNIDYGPIATDVTGATATNGVFIQTSNGTAPTTATNAGVDNFQVVANDDTHLNVLQITGTNGDKGSRQLWAEAFSDQWLFRDAGNEIIEVEFDLYTGTTGPSRNLMGLYIMDATRSKYVGGFVFNTNTLVLSGLAYYTSASAPVGNYTFFLNTGGTNLVLTANTWVRLGVSFNKTTGQVRWKGPNLNGQVTGAATGVEPDRVSLVSTSGSVTTPAVIVNTAAASTLFDNFIIRASATDTLLGVDEVATVQNTAFVVYPNPANNFINVSAKENTAITAIALTDVNGRIVKNSTYDNLSAIEMNVSDLAKGVYIMNITSKTGNSIQKFIKN